MRCRLGLPLLLVQFWMLGICLPGSGWAALRAPRINTLTPKQGGAGIQVSLLGRAFGARRGTVTFGARRARVVTWTATMVKVLSPTGRGRVSVVLRTRARLASNSKIFRYVAVTPAQGYKLFANNDLGMHCVDADFSIFSILPPFNVVNAQVIGQDAAGHPFILGQTQATLNYTPIADSTGSINSTSKEKTNFWTYANTLFGASLAPGQGLTGLYMPADAGLPAQTEFAWNNSLGLFSAAGIPIYPRDDANHANRYPLMRVSAKDAQSNPLAATDVVLPVSEETTCSACHSTGGSGASRGGISWANNANKELESRENVLRLHDFVTGTSLDASKPVLCASCHYSAALDLAGTGPNSTQQPHNTMSRAMHSFHADKMRHPDSSPLSDIPLLAGTPTPSPSEQACYKCHPGESTKCLRGAMSNVLACQNCHGNMSAVGGDHNLASGGSLDGTNDGQPRRPWKDLPRCQSCHTGDVLTHAAGSNPSLLSSDQVRLLLAYLPSDPAASPLKVSSSRFAEEANSLFRHSKGHNGVNCEGCHGSTHAIWPNSDPAANDNVAPTELQGYAGTITDCSACHRPGSLTLTLEGPHGLHNVNDSRWVQNHSNFYERSAASCQACHGSDYRGSALARVPVNRTFATEDFGNVAVPQGQIVSCYTCHNGPGAGD